MMVIDRFCYRSGLRHVNTGVKFSYAMLTLFFCIISRSLLVSGIVLAVNGILLVKKGKLPLCTFGRLMLIPLTFLLLSTIALIINLSKTPLDGYAVSIGAWYLTGSRQSLMFAVQLIFSALAAVSCLYFLSLNTPMPDIMMTLEMLHCPELLTELMLLIYRFTFVLMETATAIQTSQKSRLGYRDFRTSLHSFGQMAAVLFIRALKRSDALYDAMEARGYDGKIRVLKESNPPKRKEIISVMIFEAILLGITVWRKWL